MKNKRIINSFVIVAAFIVAFYGRGVLSSFVPVTFATNFLRVSYFYIWWLLPSLFILGYLFGFKTILKNVGLNKGLIIGFLFSAITVFPMIVSSATIGKIDPDISFGTLLHHSFVAGLFEEYFFRGFLFGVLFLKLRWGFIPASVLGGVVFGLGHTYQGSALSETLAIFAITTIGAVWFSWLYIEWEQNLWVPVFLHILMNLSWILFEVSHNAMGGLVTNLFRAITIALTIIITIRYHKKRGLIIKRDRLFVNNDSLKTVLY